MEEESGVVPEVVADNTDKLEIDILSRTVTDIDRKQLHKSVGTTRDYVLLKLYFYTETQARPQSPILNMLTFSSVLL